MHSLHFTSNGFTSMVVSSKRKLQFRDSKLRRKVCSHGTTKAHKRMNKMFFETLMHIWHIHHSWWYCKSLLTCWMQPVKLVINVCETYNFSTIDVWNIKQKIGKLFLMASKIRDHPLATIKITIGEFLTPLPDSIFIFFMHNIILWEQGRHLLGAARSQ